MTRKRPRRKVIKIARRVKVHRDPADVSPKVSYPALLLALAAVVQAVATTGWNAPETATALSALAVLVVGYWKSDRVAV